MWTHKAWRHALPAGERLRSYAGWCNAVEGNTTFYATPAKNTVASWARQTDPDFRFVVKLPRSITHERRLAGVDEELRAFLDAIEPLGPRAHALWLQLPGSFAPVDVPALASFLHRLPASYRYAVEVRHRAFFDDPDPRGCSNKPWPPRPPSGSRLIPRRSSGALRPATPNEPRGPRSRVCHAGRSR